MIYHLSAQEKAFLGNPGPARRLWLLSPPPGLTGQIVEEEILRLGFKPKEAQLALTGRDWEALRSACYARVGIPDAAAWERDRMLASSLYARWKENLRRYQAQKGIRA